MIHLFNYQNWLKNVPRNIGTFAGILPYIWNKNQGMLRKLRGPSIGADFRKLVKHIQKP